MTEVRTVLAPSDASMNPLLLCLLDARLRLSDPDWWDKSGTGPGWCPIRAVTIAANKTEVRFRFILKLRLAWALRTALPASHRTWWPECVVRYNRDPAVSHADMLAWLDRAIAVHP